MMSLDSISLMSNHGMQLASDITTMDSTGQSMKRKEMFTAASKVCFAIHNDSGN